MLSYVLFHIEMLAIQSLSIQNIHTSILMGKFIKSVILLNNECYFSEQTFSINGKFFSRSLFVRKIEMHHLLF